MKQIPNPLPPLDAETAVLARKFAPLLRLDRLEPFRPDCAGISRLATGQKSPSCRHVPPAPAGTAFVIEYALWWNGDIEHFYELEHIWICFNAEQRPIAVFASAHGGLLEMAGVEWLNGRPVLYCEPGKHAHAAHSAAITARRQDLDRACNGEGNIRGVLLNDIFAAELSFLSPYDQFLGRERLRTLEFRPSYDFTETADLAKLEYLSWDELAAEVPRYIRTQFEDLRRLRRGLKAIFLDSGDTLIDEESQVFSEEEDDLVLSARPIEGGDTLVHALADRGWPVALVADGRVKSFENVHGALGFWGRFEARAISERTGVSKPESRMFMEAMRKLGLRREDLPGVVMVGNNLKRDIRGANALGITTVWIDWNDRYSREIETETDRPDHVIHRPMELMELISRLEEASGWAD